MDDWKEKLKDSWKYINDIEGVSYSVLQKFVVNRSVFYGEKDGIFEPVDVNDIEPFPSWACDKDEFESLADLREYVKLNKHRIIVNRIDGDGHNILIAARKCKSKFPRVGNVKSKYTFIDI